MIKPKRIILGYEQKRQLHGGYKVIEYSRMENEQKVRKRTIRKDLTMTDAEDYIYRLESKHINN